MACVLYQTLAAIEEVVDGFVGDSFVAVVFVIVDVAVFGLLNVVERMVDETGADLTRDAVDDRVDDVVVFDAATFDVAVDVVLVAGRVNGL